MAPDLNSLFADGKWDYSTPGSTGYNVPDVIYNDPSARKVKVLTIGTGLSGIAMAYKIQKLCQNVELIMYEKNSDIGGTWLENRYPGCACDVPSHAYAFNWAPNPDWPRYFSYAPDIWKYLNRICETFSLRKYMNFNTEVVRMEWQETTAQWKVTLRRQEPGKELEEFEDTADLVFYATGVLNNPKLPKIEGLEKFKGKVIHTARWPEDYQKDQWKNETVAVIGSGASSIQTVPNMQPHVKHMDVFVRTGVWFVSIAGSSGENQEYSEEDRSKFRNDAASLVDHGKSIENQINGLSSIFYTGSESQKGAQQMFLQRMSEWIKDERLLKGFTPKFEIGCRRITPGDPYMKAIQKENVDVHFTAVKRITEDGVVGEDGIERKVVTIIAATGFNVSYRPRFPIIGKNGVNLQDKWEDEPTSYLGVTAPDMPNFVISIGPTWPVENGSVVGPLGQVGDYSVEMIKKMQRDQISSMTPKQDITDRFNEHTQEWYKHTVWKDSCRSWYKNNDTGRINAIWPGSSLHFMEVLKNPRWEDYEIEYQNKNPWASLGMGYVLEDKAIDKENTDFSPYMHLDNVDPQWWAAVSENPLK